MVSRRADKPSRRVWNAAAKSDNRHLSLSRLANKRDIIQKPLKTQSKCAAKVVFFQVASGVRRQTGQMAGKKLAKSVASTQLIECIARLTFHFLLYRICLSSLLPLWVVVTPRALRGG